MSPEETARHYDRIAEWIQRHTGPDYGLAALRRALEFAPAGGAALDVGCGPTGRFLRILSDAGYRPEGLDASAAMIALARREVPGAVYHHADIVAWEPAQAYAVVTAWDSIFHLPLALQEPVLVKLARLLAPGGVLLLTCGGGEPGEITGEMAGLTFGYSSIGAEANVAVLAREGCACRFLDYDQWPERHVVLIAQRRDR